MEAPDPDHPDNDVSTIPESQTQPPTASHPGTSTSKPVDIPIPISGPANSELDSAGINVAKLRNRTSSSHNLASSALNPNRKGRFVEPGTTETHSNQASISMPPPPPRSNSNARSRTSSLYSQRIGGEGWRQGISPTASDFAVEDIDTPRLSPGIMADEPKHLPLPEAALTAKSSMSDMDSKRMSVSSIYSLSSARAGGAPSSVASAAGSDAGTGSNTRTPSGSLPMGLGISHPETSTSVVSVMTSSNQFGTQGSGNGHQLSPQVPAQTPEMAKRAAAATSRGEGTPRAQPPTRDRERSRAKRRFSGSTGQSSHSPSSEKGVPQKKDEAIAPHCWGTIGVCALDVKARSKPSRSILNKLIGKGEFVVNVFGDKVILDEDAQNWPMCDFLICFYSDGFPLDKAISYVKARKPYCVNDVPMQKMLWDRRICLRILDKIGVPSPKRVEVNRDGGPSATPDMAKRLKEKAGVVLEGPEDGTGGQIPPPRKVELLDDGDTLSIDGTLISKPFIEKPVSGEDHNLCVYYPKKDGGGARKLFRKIGNKSSEWVDDLTIPRAITEPDGSFLYEQFMTVDSAEDVKAYTIGPEYCHAETRKSPVVDGLVKRNTFGKEVRYVTQLSDVEKSMASRIAVSFGQQVCGFDMLRAQGKTYVIDVNGWSFVKDNEDYASDCARILREMFIAHANKRNNTPANSSTGSTSTGTPEGTVSPVLKAGPTPKEITSHRSTMAHILSKSPSISKLTHHSHRSQSNTKAAEPAGTHSLKGTPSGIESDTNSRSQGIPATTLLPPPAVTLPDTSVAATQSSVASAAPSIHTSAEEPEDVMPPPAPKHTWKLKGMVSVIRHADRTPKQKYKFTFHTKPFIELLRGHEEEVLLTGEAALNSVMIAVDQALREGVEDLQKLKMLRNVLAKKGAWVGTKVQIKPMFRKRKPEEQVESTVQTIAEEAEMQSRLTSPEPPTQEDSADDANLEQIPDTPKRRSPQRTDSITGTTLSRITAAEKSLVLDKLQLIVKWGGEPTHSARYQAQELGENMRNDLLLMNKEVLDEVHVFSSSEKRVTTSARIFAAAFTDQEELPEDFVTVRKDLLDDSNAAKDEMDKVKKKLKTLLRQGVEAPAQFAWPKEMPEPSIVQKFLVHLMRFHRKVMRQNYSKLYGGATSSLNAIVNPGDKDKQKEKTDGTTSPGSSLGSALAMSTIQPRWCCGEDAELFKERWEKLFVEFCDSDKVDPSKISELYDTMKFDALHNRLFLQWIFMPSESVLEKEEQAMAAEWSPSLPTRKTSIEKETPSGNPKSSNDPKSSEKDGKDGGGTSSPVERNETIKSLHRRIFRRTTIVHPHQAPASYFRLYSGTDKPEMDPKLRKLKELYQLAKVLFDFICPQEYGIKNEEKLEIGLLTSLPLLKEVVQDLEEMQASDEAKSFVYFTKESHIYTLVNCILEGGVETKIKRSAIPELDYLSHICFELYESENKGPVDPALDDGGKYAYSIKITISPGCHITDPLEVQLDSRHCISCAPRRSLTAHSDWKELIGTLKAKFHTCVHPP